MTTITPTTPYSEHKTYMESLVATLEDRVLELEKKLWETQMQLSLLEAKVMNLLHKG